MKKSLITIVCLTLVLSLVLAFVGCENDIETNYAKYVVMTPDGAPSMALAQMKDNVVFNKSVGEYSLISADQIKSAFSNGEADFIIAPTNAGVQLSIKTGNYRLAAVTSWGNLYIVGDGIKSREECDSAQEFLAQFAGKTVGSIGTGAVPDVTFKHLLAQYGVEVTIDPAEAPALQTKLNEGSLDLAILGEPAVTATMTKVARVKRLANISELWKEVVGQDFPQASLFVKKTVDSETANAFMNAVSSSIEYLNASSANAKELGEYMESRKDSTLKGAVVAKSYAAMQQKFVKASEVESDVLAFVTVLGVNVTQDKLDEIILK